MNRSTPPPTYPSALKRIPAQTVEHLPNGLTFHYFSGGDQPVCRLSIVFQGGAAELGNDAISRLMLNALSEGTKSHSPEDLADILDYNGIRVSSSCHGHYSSLTFGVLNDKIDEFLEIMMAMLTAPTFPEDRLKSLQLSAKAQFETSRKEVSTIADEVFNRMIMGASHPLAQTLTSDWFDQIGCHDISRLHHRMLCPAKMHVFLSGLLNNKIVNSVRACIQTIPQKGKGYNLHIEPFSSEKCGDEIKRPYPDSYQSCVIMGMPLVARSHPDYIPLRLSIMALGGYFGSRLMTNIREDKGLTYGISAALIGSQEGSYLKIMAQCDKNHTEQVINEIRKETSLLASNPPQGAELERLKLSATTALVEILDTPTSIMGYYATQLYVETPSDYFEAQQLAIKELDTDTIKSMAQKYLVPDNFLTAIAGA